MTDKEQIIINGVDVSGCNHLVDKEACGSMECQSVECEKNPNCLFKQLSHKTQECEKMAKGYEELTEIVSPYMDDFTGYNELGGGFDIVLCVKELLQRLARKTKECEELKKL